MANRGREWRSIAITVLVVVALTMTSTAALRKKYVPAKTPNLVCKVLATSVSIAHQAGKIIRDLYNEKCQSGDIQTCYKDLRTEVDILVTKFAAVTFKHRYRKVNVITNKINTIINQNLSLADWLVTARDKTLVEMKCPKIYEEIKRKHITVWIDPLDGVKELIRGHLNHVTLLIGVSVGGYSVGGVIYQPFWENSGRVIWGLHGVGINGLEISKPPPMNLDELVYVSTRSEVDESVNIFLDFLKPNNVIRTGGTGNKVLYLLEGKAHVYVNPSIRSKRWDTAATDAILRVAGGDFTDIHGFRYNYAPYNNEYPIQSRNLFGIYATAPEIDRTNLTLHLHSIFLKVQTKQMHNMDHKKI